MIDVLQWIWYQLHWATTYKVNTYTVALTLKAFILKVFYSSVMKSFQCIERHYQSIPQHFGIFLAFQEFVKKCSYALRIIIKVLQCIHNALKICWNAFQCNFRLLWFSQIGSQNNVEWSIFSADAEISLEPWILWSSEWKLVWTFTPPRLHFSLVTLMEVGNLKKK